MPRTRASMFVLACGIAFAQIRPAFEVASVKVSTGGSGGAYLTPAILEGRWMVRISIGAIQTEREHIEGLWHLIQQQVQ